MLRPLAFSAVAAAALAAVVSFAPDARSATAATAEVGKPAPEFSLADADGKKHNLAQYKGKIVVLEWTNPGCPFVKRHYTAKTFTTLAAALGKEVVWLAVNSTHNNKPEDSKKWAKDNGLPYPTLQDPDGAVGKAYGARTTPQMFVIDPKGVVAYAGAIDADPRGKEAAPQNYVKTAVAALKDGKRPTPASTEPYGCSVKYKQ
jgi:peroxiredoxin